MYPRRSVPLHPADQKILDDARELSLQLGIRKTNVLAVGWADRFGMVKFQPDMIPIYKGEMMLHKSLMDKFGSDELKPLIASTLLHREMIGSRALRGTLAYFAPAIIAMFAVVFIVAHIFSDNSITGISAFLSFGILFFAMTRLFKLFKRVWFDADRRTAELLGVDTFLKVLEKMDAIGLGRGKPLREQPNVRDRIANLRRIQSSGPSSL